mgnify:CR=1 FL=1
MLKKTCVAALTLLWALPTFANEDALYDAPLPGDAAFVRFVGTAPGMVFGTDMPADLGEDYAVMSADTADGLEAGQYVSVLADGTVVLEAPRDGAAKVLIQLLNLGDVDVALKLADGSVEAIAPVAPNTVGSRAVNPVKVPVAVFAGDMALGDPIELVLQRGQHPTIVLDAGGARVLMSQIIRTDLAE